MSRPAGISIVITPQGIKIDSTIEDPLQCLGLLELAKGQITRGIMGETKQKSSIVAPHGINPAKVRASGQ